jgi:hypothetical protein
MLIKSELKINYKWIMGELNVNYEWIKNKLQMNDEWIMIKLQVRLEMFIHDGIHNIISSFNDKFHKEQS